MLDILKTTKQNFSIRGTNKMPNNSQFRPFKSHPYIQVLYTKQNQQLIAHSDLSLAFFLNKNKELKNRAKLF